MDQERTRSSETGPLRHAASRGASYMCVEAQPEKAAPKKFKEVRRTSTVLGSECSSEMRIPTRIYLRTVSLVPPRSKLTGCQGEGRLSLLCVKESIAMDKLL